LWTVTTEQLCGSASRIARVAVNAQFRDKSGRLRASVEYRCMLHARLEAAHVELQRGVE
jgi:hypothetical protein